MNLSNLEYPGVANLVDLDSELASAIRPDLGAIGSNETHAGRLFQVWTRGRYDADFRSGVDQEVYAREDVFDME